MSLSMVKWLVGESVVYTFVVDPTTKFQYISNIQLSASQPIAKSKMFSVSLDQHIWTMVL